MGRCVLIRLESLIYNSCMSKATEVARELEKFNEQEWVEFLNELDGVSRRRQERVTISSKPSGTGRDDVAAWVAKRHLLVDTAIREIWYLPTSSPADEIRLIELNGRLAGTDWDVEPMDFSLDVDGNHFKLLVADTTSQTLEQVKTDASRLPAGWSLSGAQVWRRGA